MAAIVGAIPPCAGKGHATADLSRCSSRHETSLARPSHPLRLRVEEPEARRLIKQGRVLPLVQPRGLRRDDVAGVISPHNAKRVTVGDASVTRIIVRQQGPPAVWVFTIDADEILHFCERQHDAPFPDCTLGLQEEASEKIDGTEVDLYTIE